LMLSVDPAMRGTTSHDRLRSYRASKTLKVSRGSRPTRSVAPMTVTLALFGRAIGPWSAFDFADDGVGAALLPSRKWDTLAAALYGARAKWRRRGVRRADFLMALAYATDLATGHSRDFALRSPFRGCGLRLSRGSTTTPAAASITKRCCAISAAMPIRTFWRRTGVTRYSSPRASSHRYGQQGGTSEEAARKLDIMAQTPQAFR